MIRHAGYWKPRIYPIDGDAQPSNIDRLQNFAGSPSITVDQLYEIGRYEKMCSQKKPPVVAISQSQFEYGSLAYYLQLAGKSSGDKIELSDFDGKFYHFIGFEGKDENTLLSSIVFPRARLTGMGLSIADPEAIITRSFTFNADTKLIYQNDNLYFIHKEETVNSLSSGNTFTITVNNPVPVANPYTGDYLFEVYRIRSGESDAFLLTKDLDYTYNNGTQELTINNCQIGDKIKFYYTASSYISGETYNTLNDVDPCALYAYNASIYLVDGAVSNYIYRLSSVTIDVGFDTVEEKEIGNKKTVEMGIRTRTVRTTMSGFVKDYTLEEVLSGKAGQNWGLIDIERFKDTIALVIKIYDNSDKQNFLIGYQIEKLSFTGGDGTVPVNDFLTKTVNLVSDNLLITTNESNLLI